MNRIEVFQQTPIPIETAYFLDNAAKFKTEKGYELVRDKNKFNKFYFNYPPEWKTANVGEMIVGIRSLWTMCKPRVFNFNIFIRKYKKKKFYEAMRQYDEKYEDKTDEELFEIQGHFTDKKIQEIINTVNEKDFVVFPFNMNISLRSKEDWYDMWNIMNETLSVQTDLKNFIKDYYTNSDDYSIDDKLKWIRALNKYNDNDELLYQYDRDIWFRQNISKSHNLFGMVKDISLYETYLNNELNECFYSDHNLNHDDAFFIDILFVNDNSTYYKKYRNISNTLETKRDEDLPDFFADDLYSPFSTDGPKPLDDSDSFNNDFNAVFNVGDKPWQNSLDFITTYHRYLNFKNIYNRESLKIHASFANESNNYYICNSHIYFNPIKYYKLNSKDDRFWIEFYSGRHYNYPVNIPEDEGFILEMLFMQNQKLLYT